MTKVGLNKIIVELPDDWDDPEDLPHIIVPVPNDGIINHPRIYGQALRKFDKYFKVGHPGTERLLGKILEEGKKQ